MPILLLGLLLLNLRPALAEYRAFLLVIRDQQNQVVRSFPSSLDPQQYPILYPLDPGQSISYQQTWMCRGNTSYKPEICPAPSETAAGTTPAQPPPPTEKTERKPSSDTSKKP